MTNPINLFNRSTFNLGDLVRLADGTTGTIERMTGGVAWVATARWSSWCPVEDLTLAA